MADERNQDWRGSALDEYKQKRDVLAKRHEELQSFVFRLKQQLNDLQHQEDKIQEEIADLDKAAVVFGLLDVQSETQSSDEDGEAPEGLFVKDIALAALKEAFPNPLRAAQIKEIAERKLGRALHSKTAGMTLYRLSQSGAVYNKGWNWYLIPAE
jgi:hypothetical protein